MNKILKKSIYLFALSCLIGVTCAIIFFNKSSKDEQITKSLNISSSEPIEEYQYILKEFEGKLAVFNKNEKDPEMIFDVSIENLPEIDILELKQGLKIKDTQELNDRIEDFIS